MTSTVRNVLLVVVGVTLLGGGGWYAWQRSRAPHPLDGFAQCLTAKGVTMYGASWCPHCARQKELFGRAFRYATYVECALPGNPNAQTRQCTDAGIQGYPTWVFADGTRKSGELTLQELSEKTGCALSGAPAPSGGAVPAVQKTAPNPARLINAPKG